MSNRSNRIDNNNDNNGESREIINNNDNISWSSRFSKADNSNDYSTSKSTKGAKIIIVIYVSLVDLVRQTIIIII